ncbi:MAG: homoserine dehydrogenase [Proteobacteria bacterium]|nr:homoserine dehydrogenase [Pseudomonadota bacterium]
MRRINAGIIGFGTVGTGVVKLLTESRELISSRIGADLCLKYVADLDIKKDRGVTLDQGVLITDAEKVVSDPEIDIVVELIGGETIAKKLMLKAIENGKHVVTANKALLASSGSEIFAAARKYNVDLGFEASVAGCIPIIKSIKESLAANRIHSVSGILNGTCNYILSKITSEGTSFAVALKNAQENGYAEADPTLDIEGFDAAHKLAIITALAYGMTINLDDIYVEGISGIALEDIRYAEQLGYRVKLLAISKHVGEGIEARVHPTMIPFDNLFASVNDSVNAINVKGDAVGDMFFVGRGAGMMPTASAVVSDMIDISRNILSCTSQRVPLLSYRDENIKTIPVVPMDEIWSRYYFRFTVVDRPGVLSTISGILGNSGISIKSVQQTEEKKEGPVPIVMVSGPAREADVKKAIANINTLSITDGNAIVIRIGEDVSH